MPHKAATLALGLAALFAVTGCGGGAPSSSAPGANQLVIYSGREQELVAPLYERFEKQTGIEVDVRYGESPELSATLAEEGEHTKADVFYAQDAGAIGALASGGRLSALRPETLAKVPARFRAPDGTWVGVSGRVRVLAYNTDELRAAELPASIFGLVSPRWKGKIGMPPGNASFQSFVTAMQLSVGRERTKRWLEAMKRNDIKVYEKNGQVVEAIARGEIVAGLVNHYYVFELRAEQPDAPVANHFFAGTDPGTFVNVSAVGVLRGAEHALAARKFVDFLLGEGQHYLANATDEKEYPLASGSGARAASELKPLASIKGPDVELSGLGERLRDTVELIDSVGFSAS